MQQKTSVYFKVIVKNCSCMVIDVVMFKNYFKMRVYRGEALSEFVQHVCIGIRSQGDNGTCQKRQLQTHDVAKYSIETYEQG